MNRILMFLVATIVFTAVPAASQTASKPLFRIAKIQRSEMLAEKSSPASVREADIEFPASLAELSAADVLEIPGMDGEANFAGRTSSEIRALDDRTWRGKITAGKFEGDVTLTFRKGVVSGLIYTPKAVYEIVPRGGRHILVELDQSLFPECGGELKGDGAPPPSLGSQLDSGDRIDVMVVYTTATKNFLGGDAQAQAVAQQAVDAANTAYINSKVRLRARLVHAQEHLYTESGNHSTDLSNLRNNATVRGLRDTHKADLVAMLAEITTACGVGYLMGSGNPDNGYTVTGRSCAVGNLSFAHELGHNMGSHHNPENGSGASYPYSYGHYVNGVFRTVMSYVDPCPSGCARRQYFSNPAIYYQGYPTGIHDARDNVRSMNNTADVIANFRYSGRSLTINDYNGGDIVPRGILSTLRPLTWNSANITGNVRIELSRDEGTTWETLIPDTADDNSQPVIIRGPMTKRARLRISSIDFPWVTDSSMRNITLR